MNQEHKILETMECLHASDDICERVLAQAHGAPRRKAGHAWPMAAVIALLGVVLTATGGAAYAVLSADADFFPRIWGGHGMEGKNEWSFATDSGDVLSYSRTVTTLDPDELGADFANKAEGVGLSTTGNGYTLDVESMIVDANGCGAVTLRLSNPNGVKYAPQYGGPGDLVLNGEHTGGIDLVGMSMVSGDPDFASTELILDSERSSDTEFYVTMYFDAWGQLDAVLSGVYWEVAWHTGEGDDTQDFRVQTEVFYPSKVVDTVQFEGDGFTAKLSPLSVAVVFPKTYDDEALLDYVSFILKDGSEIVVDDDVQGAMNYYTGTCWDKYTVGYTPSQPVNASEVESVVIRDRDYHDDGRTYELVEHVLTVK